MINLSVLAEESVGTPSDDAEKNGCGSGDDDTTIVGTEAGDGFFDGAGHLLATITAVSGESIQDFGAPAYSDKSRALFCLVN